MADTFALQQDLTGDIGSAIIVGGGYTSMGTGWAGRCSPSAAGWSWPGACDRA